MEKLRLEQTGEVLLPPECTPASRVQNLSRTRPRGGRTLRDSGIYSCGCFSNNRVRVGTLASSIERAQNPGTRLLFVNMRGSDGTVQSWFQFTKTRPCKETNLFPFHKALLMESL